MLTIVVVSPHRDDSAFSLGLTIAEWLQAGHRIRIVNCFTRSDYAPYLAASSAAFSRTSQVSAVRKKEDDAWRCQYTGEIEITDLDLEDAPLRLGCSYGSVCNLTLSADDNSISKIQNALRQINFDAIVLPLGLGRHIDHLTAREAALSLIGDGLPYAFYEDLPYAALAEDASIIEQTAKEMKVRLNPMFVNTPIDTAASIERKHRFARAYSSQIDEEAAWQIARFCERYEGRERLWANSTWCESALRGDCGASTEARL